MSENSIEFSLSNSEQRDSWLNSGHQTLDADNGTVNACVTYAVSFPIDFACGYLYVPEFFVTKLEGTYPVVLGHN